jgi:hypothetical protein
LNVAPPSGQAGIEIAISGQDFTPYVEYAFYWDTLDTPIGLQYADDIGQIQAFAYTVPAAASPGTHQIVVILDGVVMAQAPFEVMQ